MGSGERAFIRLEQGDYMEPISSAFIAVVKESAKSLVKQFSDKVPDFKIPDSLGKGEMEKYKPTSSPDRGPWKTEVPDRKVPDFQVADHAADKEKISLDEKVEKMGGAYKDLPSKPDCEKHHMPAHDTTDIPFNDGPCIVMEKGDHRQTASCGNSREAQEYRNKQKELISDGKFEEAMQMDIDDIQSKFGDKYDDAIAEMKEYAESQKEKGTLS